MQTQMEIWRMLPFGGAELTAEEVAKAMELRVELARQINDMAAIKKAHEVAKDYPAAKEVAQEIRRLTRLQTAMKFWLNWLAIGCTDAVPPFNWPTDLNDEFQTIEFQVLTF